ncbi:MAG TPA: hypothetical protein PLR88_01910 [Bacteroidales bacterium]|nr:hypothetical protein [Bacteroidales bacterium]HPT20675.1 hypothetical protein [Bacteroidales bacterium]
MKKIFLLICISLFTIGISNGQIFNKNSLKVAEKGLFGKSRKDKKVKIREPKTVTRAKKKQEANDKRLKKEYAKSVKESQKRSYEIQTPEVKARMKQNQKDTALRDKMKKKKVKSDTKKAGKKYN